MSSNVARRSEGVTVISATTNDERHPASSVIDVSDPKSFWYTSGMYPQEFVIAFTKEASPNAIVVVTRHVKHFTMFKCDKSEAKSWDEFWKSGDVDKNDGGLQTTKKESQLSSGIRFLKLRIDSGYEEFAAVYEVRVEASGSTASAARMSAITGEGSK